MALEEHMIEPFEPDLVREGVLSYGLSSYGYDLRLADQFKIPVGAAHADSPERATFALDPKDPQSQTCEDVQAAALELAPHSFVLGRSVEYLRIPLDILTLCVGKSSYARCGVLVNVTPFEPGWEGYVTLCIANLGPRPVRLHAGEGIAQVLFLQGDGPCEVTYADRRGKYQAQQGITLTRLG